MKINKALATALVRTEVGYSETEQLDASWVKKVETLSRLCEQGAPKTHIAFLGAAIIAKAMNRSADLYAIKPKHAKDNPNAFSIRTLCHSVLVPLAAEFGINIGVTGREPLNNQPYFRMTRLGDDTPIHAGGRAAFDYMLELIGELQALPDEESARAPLRAFIAVRRRYQPRYDAFTGGTSISHEQLIAAIQEFVRADSEGGRRAQAVVAGLLDVFAGPGRVESGRINDPSRHYPGDVCVRAAGNPEVWEKAIEVKDKPINASDVQIFGKKCVDMGVQEAAIVMTSDRQIDLDKVALFTWANGFGIGLTLFHGWNTFIDQVLFWSELPKPVAATRAVEFIHQRLIAVEASPEALPLWSRLTYHE
jgi:hypothetical protein